MKEYVKEFSNEKSFNDYKDNNLLFDCGRIIGRCALDTQFTKIEVVDKIQLNIDILDADNFVINGTLSNQNFALERNPSVIPSFLKLPAERFQSSLS